MPSFPFDLAGPRFLLFYVLFAPLAIGAAVLLRRLLEGGPAPKVDLSDPYLLACLRGGKVEALRVAVLSLLDRGILDHKAGRFLVKEGVDPASLRRPLEKAVLRAVGEEGRTGRFFERDKALEREADRIAEDLERRGLLPGDRERAGRWAVTAGALLLVGGTGVAKIVIGLSRDRPVSFLVVLTAAASLAAVILVRRPARTARGDRVLADSRTLYGRLRARAGSLPAGGGQAEAALLAGVFGLEALSGGAWSRSVAAVAPPRPAPGSSGGSSCGTTFSSCSSPSCGSSCGGGGGCGGCGGS